MAILVNGDSSTRKERELALLPNEIKVLIEFTNQERTKGYNFHQKAFNSNTVVKEWVLRENYWDYKLPHPHD